MVLPTSTYDANGIKRFVNLVSFRNQLRRQITNFVDWQPDIVVASSTHPLDVRPAFEICRRTGASLVFEVHDLWPLTPQLLGGLSRLHPMIVWMRREESFAYRHADLVLSLLPRTRDYMISRGLEGSRWFYSPNGYDTATTATPCPPDLAAWVTSIRERWGFLFAFAGTISSANALEPFLETARHMESRNAALVVIGAGPDQLDLQSRYGSLPNVFFKGAVPNVYIRDLLARFDAAYMGLTDSPLYDYGISLNKMYDYMGSGIPIVENIAGNNGIVKEIGCGIGATPGDVTSLVGAMEMMVDADPTARHEWATRGQDFVFHERSRNALAERALSAFQSLRE